RRHDRKGSRAGFADPFECGHDPPNCAEKADERGGRTCRSKKGQVLFEPGYLGCGSPAKRPGNVVDAAEVGTDYFRVALLQLFFTDLFQFIVTFGKKYRVRGIGEPVNLGTDRIEPFGLPEEGQK